MITNNLYYCLLSIFPTHVSKVLFMKGFYLDDATWLLIVCFISTIDNCFGYLYLISCALYYYLIKIVLVAFHIKNIFAILYLVKDEKELSLEMLIAGIVDVEESSDRKSVV